MGVAQALRWVKGSPGDAEAGPGRRLRPGRSLARVEKMAEVLDKGEFPCGVVGGFSCCDVGQ